MSELESHWESYVHHEIMGQGRGCKEKKRAQEKTLRIPVHKEIEEGAWETEYTGPERGVGRKPGASYHGNQGRGCSKNKGGVNNVYLKWKGNGEYKYGQYFQGICCVKEWQLNKEDVGLQRFLFFFNMREMSVFK